MKLSQYPPDSSPTIADYLIGNKAVGPSTQNFTLLSLVTLFWTLANIPSGGTSPITRDNETQFAFIASGLVITGDSYGVNKNWSITAGVVYINGIRISIAAQSANVATASKDTYVDVLSNGDGTGTLVFTGGNIVTNNVASPALASNSLRVGIVVCGASSIAAATSINQGQETMVLPIASSVPYAVTDSLGNLICPRDPNRKILGYRQITGLFSTASTSVVQITGLSCPFIVPTGRKVKVSIFGNGLYNGTAGARAQLEAWDGTVGSGTRLSVAYGQAANSNSAGFGYTEAVTTPGSTSKTYNAGLLATATGTASFEALATTSPGFIKVELV